MDKLLTSLSRWKNNSQMSKEQADINSTEFVKYNIFLSKISILQTLLLNLYKLSINLFKPS